jgi:predicted HD superfamily hydrolase involved in NAD metabolism
VHDLYARLIRGVPLTGDPCSDMAVFLAHHGHTETVDHSHRVAVEAEKLATRFGANPSHARIAGCLHDVSAAIPVAKRASVAEALGLEILPEEEAAPMLLHQKLSAVMARDVFGIADRASLCAIQCHTTLKASASLLDKVVFVADKVAWDQSGVPPYLKDITHALRRSLDQAALCYLDYLWQRRDTLLAVHPWFVQAYKELASHRKIE